MAIISFRHNFIFIKTRKTAGTSIEVDLSAIAGDDAIVTPIQPVEAGHDPRNYLDENGKQRFFNHMPASEIRDRLGAERFSSMFKFCVEREPVEKCISLYHMQRNSAFHNPDGQYDLSWDEFCKSKKLPVDLDKYSEIRDGSRILMVDRVLRYDQLASALPAMMHDLGIENFQLRTRAKTEYSRHKLVTEDMVTPGQRKVIRDAFAATVSVTGIEW